MYKTLLASCCKCRLVCEFLQVSTSRPLEFLKILCAVLYGYPVPKEIIRRSGKISTSKLTSRPLLFQTNIPTSRALAFELLEQNIQSVLKEKNLKKKKHNKSHFCNANYKTNTKLQKHRNALHSEFKWCYLCAEKFTTDKKFIIYRLCMHNTV